MSLLSRFSKVEKSFLGQCLTRHKFPPKSPLFSNFSLFLNIWSTYHCYRKYHWPLWPVKHVKENGGLSEIKTRRSKEHFCVSNGVSPRFSYFWKIPPYTLKRHRVKGCFWSGKHLLCEVYFLSFGYDDGVANRCNRFLVAEVRDDEGKPYF